LSKAGAAIPDSGFVRQASTFIRDFAAFAGASGVRAAILAILDAASEGVRLGAARAAIVDGHSERRYAGT
jgi:hypothetical protein